jgi:hypothetical protein
MNILEHLLHFDIWTFLTPFGWTLFEHLCTFMDIYGHLCTFMDIYGHLWTF